MELSATNELHRWAEHALPADSARPLHRYAIISELGSGGMSTVHLAHDRATGRVVAVKRVAGHVASAPDALRRFAREAGIVAQLRHPNIVETVAVERHGDAPLAIVTEYVRGASLRDILRDTKHDTLASSGALPVDRVVRVLRDVASALAYTHARNIVHRDVKPANILIESDTGRALLADFGIACESGARADVDDGLTIGTPAYMAPEQIEGRAVDARADVYALCVVGWEMLAGQMPWTGAPLADLLHRQRYEPLPDLAQLRPEIPVYLLRAINRGLAKDPAMRWRDGAELLHALSPRPTPPEPPRRAPAPLDATVRDATVQMEETQVIRELRRERPPTEAPEAPASPRGRPGGGRLLATTFGTIAIALALGGLAPHLSHGAAAPHPSIDPELDSMLTLAVTPQPTAAAPSPVRKASAAACRAVASRVGAPGVRASGQVAHCSAASRHPVGSRTRVRHRRR